MLIATVIHWDRFNHGDAPTLAAIAFYAWTVVYVISPFAVFAIWWRNRATDPRVPDADDPRVPAGALLAARAFAAGDLRPAPCASSCRRKPSRSGLGSSPR
jgi:hypothetical protein